MQFILFLLLQEEPKILDTRELPVFRKRVCPQSRQEECESRLLWHKVTHALKTGDIEAATSAKHEVSQVLIGVTGRGLGTVIGVTVNVMFCLGEAIYERLGFNRGQT